MRIRIRGTKVDINWGTLIHVLFGLLAVFLHQEWVFTVIFLFKQYVDLHGGEASDECSGDIAEYSVGLVLGILVRRVLAFA